MDTRELVILFVGFAIVWVLLRGLYVALQARRGQIRLAIDKNIPQDVDLDALEMTELPSGGARVVARTLEEVNIQNRAHETFEGVGDDENELVPILTDTVELSNPNEAGSENVSLKRVRVSLSILRIAFCSVFSAFSRSSLCLSK